MASSHPSRESWSRLAAVFGVWSGLAVVLTGQAYLVVYIVHLAHDDLPRDRTPLAWWELFLSVLAECLIWAVLTLGILWLARRFPLGRGRWLQSLAIHVGACLVCGFIAASLSAVAAELIREELPRVTITLNVLVLFFVLKLNNNIFFYAAILAVAHVLNYYRELRERELLSAQLESKLAQTQLQILKMQLHPHFLFNTLNAISALIHQDVELADRMIARLGDLLRTTLDRANQQEVTLREELDFIEPYLEIEKARLGSRLAVEFDIDPATLDAKAPNLILQPIVENAIRHGIAVSPLPGTIRIRAWREADTLHLSIEDTGPGMHDASTSDGIGIANTRARLAKLYGDAHSFDLINGSQGGLRVVIVIPLRIGTTARAKGDIRRDERILATAEAEAS